jgi:hypothetical protein
VIEKTETEIEVGTRIETEAAIVNVAETEIEVEIAIEAAIKTETEAGIKTVIEAKIEIEAEIAIEAETKIVIIVEIAIVAVTTAEIKIVIIAVIKTETMKAVRADSIMVETTTITTIGQAQQVVDLAQLLEVDLVLPVTVLAPLVDEKTMMYNQIHNNQFYYISFFRANGFKYFKEKEKKSDIEGYLKSGLQGAAIGALGGVK